MIKCDLGDRYGVYVLVTVLLLDSPFEGTFRFSGVSNSSLQKQMIRKRELQLIIFGETLRKALPGGQSFWGCKAYPDLLFHYGQKGCPQT